MRSRISFDFEERRRDILRSAKSVVNQDGEVRSDKVHEESF